MAGNTASEDGPRSLSSYRIPFKNSSKYPKEARPPHLQDAKIFDSLSLEAVTNQLSAWAQTKATQEATAFKQRKMDKSGNKENTPVKPVKVLEGVDDTTYQFHPQIYSLRPPVGGPVKVWEHYPTHWPEVFY